MNPNVFNANIQIYIQHGQSCQKMMVSLRGGVLQYDPLRPTAYIVRGKTNNPAEMYSFGFAAGC